MIGNVKYMKQEEINRLIAKERISGQEAKKRSEEKLRRKNGTDRRNRKKNKKMEERYTEESRLEEARGVT